MARQYERWANHIVDDVMEGEEDSNLLALLADLPAAVVQAATTIAQGLRADGLVAMGEPVMEETIARLLRWVGIVANERWMEAWKAARKDEA